MENAIGHNYFIETLPGTKPESIINDVNTLLRKGKVLTTLDAVNSNRTVCLPKYVSLLRSKYGVPIRSKWIELSNNKRIKLYWIPKEQSN
jgi:hypothetical protein